MTEYGDLFNAAVAAELRAERGRTGTTLGRLVEETGVAQSTIQRYLKGKRDIPMTVLADMCRTFGVSARTIFERAEKAIEEN